jgi:integrase
MDSNVVKQFRDDLIKGGVSRPTAKKILQSLRGILAEAKDRGDIAENPALGIKLVISKREREKVEIPSMEEIRRILEKADELATQGNKQFAKAWRRYRMMVMVSALTGLRVSELRGLPWPNTDLKAGTIRVSQRADETKRIGRPKSEAGERTIEISAALTQLLREWRMECVPGVLKLVFPNGKGNVEALSNIHRRGWYPLLERAGIVDETGRGRYTWHSLRHFRASVLIDRGATPKEVMVEMGHSSVTMTFNTYGHLFPDGKNRRKQRAEEIDRDLIPAKPVTNLAQDAVKPLIEGQKLAP